MDLKGIITDRAYASYDSTLEKEVRAGEMPKHIAIIMDGNRRYAEEVLGEAPLEGHKLGREKLEEVLHWCMDLDIPILTVYAFSMENFKRAEDEVEYLMELLEQSLYEFADDEEVHANRVAIKVIGERSALPENVLKAMDYATERTGMYTDHYLNMAIAYGGRQDIANAARAIAVDVREGRLDPEDIDEDTVSRYVSTTGMPDPDLVLRTSGEVRVSNFLLWQLAYSELYFTDVYWPGFRHIDFLRAIRTYQQRVRRFGR
ncbi:MAG: polyprenyl diphosphate synthase [Thermoplasmata archaeon]|nr:polyprenyl diphosphate synthase [Thermoplasmata archaeon]